MEYERFRWRWRWRSGKMPRWWSLDIVQRGHSTCAVLAWLGPGCHHRPPGQLRDHKGDTGDLFWLSRQSYSYFPKIHTNIDWKLQFPDIFESDQLTWTRTIASTVQISGRQLNSIDQEINDSCAVELITILVCSIESSWRENIPPPLIDTLSPAPFSDCFLARGGAHGGGYLGYLSTTPDLKISVNYLWSWQTERCYHLLSEFHHPDNPCPALSWPHLPPSPPPNARWSVKECDL